MTARSPEDASAAENPNSPAWDRPVNDEASPYSDDADTARSAVVSNQPEMHPPAAPAADQNLEYGAAEAQPMRSVDRDAARARTAVVDQSGYEAAPAQPSFLTGAAQTEETPGRIRVDDEPVRKSAPNDGFLSSVALLVLRLVTAAAMGTHGAQKLQNMEATVAFFSKTQLPVPEVFAWATGIGEVLIAAGLVFGALVRLAGAGIVAIAAGALATVKWTGFSLNSLIVPGTPGFTGELELLLGAIGLVFLCLGGGGWAIDRLFRGVRAQEAR